MAEVAESGGTSAVGASGEPGAVSRVLSTAGSWVGAAGVAGVDRGTHRLHRVVDPAQLLIDPGELIEQPGKIEPVQGSGVGSQAP